MPIEVPADLELRGERIEWPGERWLSLSPEDLEELYLRGLRDLNLDNRSDIQRFISRYGWMGSREFPAGFGPQLPDKILTSVMDAETLEERGQHRSYRRFEHIEEFRFYVRTIRDLTTIWHDYRRGKLRDGPTRWESSRLRPDAEDSAILNLALWLQDLLGDHFRPRLLEQPATYRPVTLPLVAVMAAQLFNHIVENAPYRTCKNETCKRLFVRKLGGAEYGQHHSKGIFYCSLNCARAQAQRDFRRRKKADKREEKR